MKYETIIGIDAGISGGIAVWRESGIRVGKMPAYKNERGKNETDIEAINEILQGNKDRTPIIFIEKVQGWVSDTDENQGKRFMIQKMLNNYTALITVIKMSNIPFIEVRPQDWQNYLALGIKGMEKSLRKKMYVKAAESYYPTVKATLWSADALCIVHYGRLRLHTDPNWVRERLEKKNQGRKLC